MINDKLSNSEFRAIARIYHAVVNNELYIINGEPVEGKLNGHLLYGIENGGDQAKRRIRDIKETKGWDIPYDKFITKDGKKTNIWLYSMSDRDILRFEEIMRRRALANRPQEPNYDLDENGQLGFA